MWALARLPAVIVWPDKVMGFKEHHLERWTGLFTDYRLVPKTSVCS